MLKVIKKDGRIVDFDREKVISSIKRAEKTAISNGGSALWDSIIESIADTAEEYCNRSLVPIPVREVRGIIEDKLMSFFAYSVVRSYIEYNCEKRYYKSMIS